MSAAKEGNVNGEAEIESSAKAEENGDVDIEYEVKEQVYDGPTRCDRCQESCLSCCQPILAEHRPLPSNPNILERFKFALLCPPHGRIGAAFFLVLVGVVWWGLLWCVTGKEALPGGNLFSLFMLFFCCWIGGYLINLIRLPPLLGMLLVGGILGNVPKIDIANDINDEWGIACRQIALAVILIRAGLGLDPAALRRLSFVVIRLAFSPCLSEAIVDGIAAHLILGFPWQWGFMLGFVIAAVSPAVVVPSLLSLSERGYGLDKGVPTLIIAAASVDDVLSITGFGVLLGITFSSGDIVWNICKGPIEAIVGIVAGVVLGVVLWYVPQRKSKHLVLFRSAMLVGLGLLLVFGSKRADWSGAGPLACLTLAFVAAFRWRQEYPEGQKNPVEEVVGVLWMIFQPLLFGLIAAAVEIDKLNAETVGEGVAVLCIGLAVRCFVAFLATYGTNFNMKEKLFVPIAWLPKATVQAAIGAIAYDTARETGRDDLLAYGEKVLQLAVLSILLTAPTGAGLIAVFGPMLLHRTPGADKHTHEKEIDINELEASMPLQDIAGRSGITEDKVEEACVERSGSLRSVGKNKVGDESQIGESQVDENRVQSVRF